MLVEVKVFELDCDLSDKERYMLFFKYGQPIVAEPYYINHNTIRWYVTYESAQSV
jgi:hypothetical protein